MARRILDRNEQVVEETDADGRVVEERVEKRPVVADRPLVEDSGTVPVTGRASLFGRRKVVASPVSGEPVVTEPVDRTPAVDAPATGTPDEVVVEKPRWAHTSVSAILGLVLGVVALCATLTGLLAPVGVALGVVGALVALVGLIRASRRGVTGHTVAFLGLAAAMGAVVLGVLAINDQLSWLNSNTDEVSKLHDWLNAQFTWLKRW